MMKRFLIGLGIAGVMALGAFGFGVTNDTQVDTEPYTYIVTEINGDEINGIATNHISQENGGVVLSKSLDNIDVKVGDTVTVEYGEEFDEILDVKVIN